jgi:hypothetical protein
MFSPIINKIDVFLLKTLDNLGLGNAMLSSKFAADSRRNEYGLHVESRLLSSKTDY